MEQFAWIDVITLALILILAIKGVINGLIKEIFGLFGIVGGVYLAIRYADMAGVWINTNLFTFGNESSMYLIGFLSVLVGFWVGSLIVGLMFSKLIRLSGLGFIDKLLGFVVGGAKIFLIFSMIFVAISHVEFVQEKLNKYLKNSIMYPIFIETGAYIIDIKPSKLPSFALPKKENKIEPSQGEDKNIQIQNEDNNLSQGLEKSDANISTN